MRRLIGALLLTSGLWSGAAEAQTNNVGGFDNNAPLTISGLTATSHSASQALGNLQTVSVFRTVAPASAIFDFLTLNSQGGSTGALTVYVYDALPSSSSFACKDGNAFAEGGADVAKRAFAPFSVTPAVPQGATASSIDYAATRSVQNHDSPQTTNLYLCFVANGTITPGTTTDYVYKIGMAQD